jgi:hypothetical protein
MAPSLFNSPTLTPLFILTGGIPLKYAYFQARLKSTFRDMGEDERFISSQSLRIGGATALLASGASETEVKQMGRWLSSDMPQLYANLAQESARGACIRMAAATSITADSRHHIHGWF